MSAHTPGPWMVLEETDHEPVTLTVVFAPGRETCVAATWHGVSNGQSVDEAEANAARIVACVNACEGMKDPAAVIQSLRDDSLVAATLRARCDELAAALRALARHDTFTRSYDGAAHESDRQAAYAALAKVQP